MVPGEEPAGRGIQDGKKQVIPFSSDPGVSSDPLIHVLYVDDDPDMASFFRMYLEKMGKFKIYCVKNGKEALSFLGGENPCDIIISDYYMPVMDGIGLLKELHKNPSSPPFILFTGKGREEVVMEAINNGAAFYLQKGGDTRTLFAELVHKIKQAIGKYQAESALRESEEKFRLLFESARDAILILKDGIIIDCNKQASVFFRVDHGMLTSMHILDLSPEIQPDGSVSREWYATMAGRIIDGDHPLITWRLLRPDGSTFDAEANLTRIDLDHTACIQMVIRDITERLIAEQELNEKTVELEAANEELKAAEEELHENLDKIVASQEQLAESEKKFRELADLLPQIVYECDKKGRITYANQQAYTTFGYTPETVPEDLYIIDLIIPEERETVLKAMVDIPRYGRSNPHEYHAFRSDGTVFPVIISSAPIIKSGEFVGLRGIVLDITDQKKAAEDLARSEEKYRILVEHIQDGVFIIQDGILQFVNPAMAGIIGSSVEEIIGKEMKSFIAPEDRDLVIDRYNRRLAGEPVPERYEFRVLHSDGQISLLESMDIGMTTFQGKIAIIGTIRDVTVQRQAEEALRESERRLASVIDFLPDATLVIDPEGRVIAWNRAMEQLTGVPGRQILGKGNYEYSIPFYGVRRPILIDLALKSDKDVEKLYLSMDRSGDIIVGEAYMPHLRGGTVYLWGAATPLRNSAGIIVGAIESIRDITERKRVSDELQRAREDLEQRVADRTAELTNVNATLTNEVEERKIAESALRESEERYRRVVELSPDAIFVHDGSVVLFVNQAGVRLLGASSSLELTGLGFQRFMSSSLTKTGINEPSDEKSAAESTREEQFIRLDGSFVDVEVSSAPVVYQGSPAIIVVVRDITARKKVAEQLRRHAEEMSQKNKELDFLANQLLDVNKELDRRVNERTSQVIALMKQKDDFIIQLGHDLKTPLTPLRALLPTLIEDEKDPDIRESLTILLRSVHSIQDQTEKILMMARLTRDDIAVHPEPVLIRHCIADSVQKNWLNIQRKNLSISLDIPGDIEVLFSSADAGTVFDNLISNAVKYSHECGKIIINAAIEKNDIWIRVTDQGVGLSSEEAAHVFDEFYMADSSRHDRSSSGLGLSIVRRIITLYGGTAMVESEGKGKGATFSVSIPLATAIV